jgi:hypothetical protein
MLSQQSSDKLRNHLRVMTQSTRLKVTLANHGGRLNFQFWRRAICRSSHSYKGPFQPDVVRHHGATPGLKSVRTGRSCVSPDVKHIRSRSTNAILATAVNAWTNADEWKKADEWLTDMEESLLRPATSLTRPILSRLPATWKAWRITRTLKIEMRDGR